MSFFSLLFSLPMEFLKDAQKNLSPRTERNIYLSPTSTKSNNVFFSQFSQEPLSRFLSYQKFFGFNYLHNENNFGQNFFEANYFGIEKDLFYQKEDFNTKINYEEENSKKIKTLKVSKEYFIKYY